LDPVGAQIHLVGGDGEARSGAQSPPITVVGVVSDIKQIRVIDAPVRQEFYLAEPQFAELGRSLTMMVRSSIDAPALTSSVRRAIKSIDPELPVYDARKMSTVVADSFGAKLIATVLLAFFAVVALVLSALGTYAVMAYSVAQRTREVGLRLALGARPDSILKLIMRRGMTLALAGLGIGTAIAFFLGRLALRIQYGLTPVNLFSDASSSLSLILAAIVVLLFSVALAACYIPARRAMHVDPMVTLRLD